MIVPCKKQTEKISSKQVITTHLEEVEGEHLVMLLFCVWLAKKYVEIMNGYDLTWHFLENEFG